MHLIYRGGSSKNSKNRSIFSDFSSLIISAIEDNKEVIVITSAKKRGAHDNILLKTLGFLPKKLDRDTKQKPNWGNFDLIVIPGGDPIILKKELLRLGFAINKLKKDITIIGDSAGAYMLSKHFVKRDSTQEKGYTLEEGLFPESNLFTITHSDNTRLIKPSELKMAEVFAKKLKDKLLLLKEDTHKSIFY